MKRYLKLISLFLAIVMLVASFASCAGDNSGDPGNTDNETQATTKPKEELSQGGDVETEYMPEIDKNNYKDEFYLWIMGDSNPVDCYWVSESSNDVLSDAVYNRQENVRKYLGVEVIGADTESENRYVQPFKTAVQNKDGSVDLLIAHVYYGIDGFITGNYLTDFNDISEINLNADYWKLDVMEGVGINDRLYLGYSEFNILYTHVITFNKSLLEKYEDALDESVYSMVENYHWTLDKMIWLASLGYIDATSDGKTDDDQYGIVGYQSVPFVGFVQASDIQLVDMDNQGNYVLSCYNATNKTKMSSLVDKIKGLALSEFSCFRNDYSYPTMTSGRALMEVSGTTWLRGYLNSGVEFGILPFPMYDEAQKNVGYRSLQWGGYLCVPSYMGEGNRPTMIGETIEMLTYYSDAVATAYYEKLLGKQVAEAPDDRRMLQIVWDSVCSDIGQTYFSLVLNTHLLYVLPRVTKADSTDNLASFIGGIESTVNKSFKQFVKKVK